MLPRWLVDALSGKVSLSRAFWLYGFGISVVYSFLGLLVDIQNPPIVMIYLLVGLALGALQTIILWRSASNSRSRLLGRIVRTVMIFGLIVAAIMTYVLLTNWSSLAGV